MLLYYITDRSQFPGGESARCERLLERITAAAQAGVDYIQLREKDMTARALEGLARAAVERVRAAGTPTKLLINSRIDVAIAVGAAGVHLRADDIPVGRARNVFRQSGVAQAILGVSCHCKQEVQEAREESADFVVFGPVFEKSGGAGVGVQRLSPACAVAAAMPVFALGGVTTENAAECVRAGAAGVAGIRLFQSGDLSTAVAALRAIRR